MDGRSGLRGLRVLVPRGGAWGEAVAAELRSRGAQPLVVPLVAFAPPDEPAFEEAVDALRGGGFDWLLVTSATTVEALVARGAGVPRGTRVGAVGAATRAALERAGIGVDLVPTSEQSALGLVRALPDDPGRVLLPQSDLADAAAAEALAARGARVTAVVAYRTVAVPVDAATRADAAGGRLDAVLVTSGSVARQVAAQLGPLPAATLVACLGPRTAAEAEAAGLAVAVVAPERSVTALLDALERVAGGTDGP